MSSPKPASWGSAGGFCHCCGRPVQATRAMNLCERCLDEVNASAFRTYGNWFAAPVVLDRLFERVSPS